MRKTFTMTEEQKDTLLAAMKPTPVMYLSGGTPMGPSQQDNANAAWRKLGKEMGFDGMTVEAIPNECDLHFTAEVVDGD